MVFAMPHDRIAHSRTLFTERRYGVCYASRPGSTLPLTKRRHGVRYASRPGSTLPLTKRRHGVRYASRPGSTLPLTAWCSHDQVARSLSRHGACYASRPVNYQMIYPIFQSLKAKHNTKHPSICFIINHFTHYN
ncbi:hypothetical protein QVD17_30916 [Tagetes erecta]|uniref:Uncharacterized protein n=1 Tax=Tagetes erecta TaxID=13708 RepID=A0AAD8NMS0_TARER|nr:hypothetical protein QVD17_30916 [Tagetes erecta]